MPRSKGLSTEADAALDASATAPEPPPDITGKVPGWIGKLGGFGATVAAIEAERKLRKLPGLLSKEYRFVLGRPGGIPFTFPVTVLYKPESTQEQNLGTFRIGR